MKHAHDHFRFVRVPTSGALALLNGEPQGLGLTFEGLDGLGQVAVRDTTTPGNNLSNAPADSFLTQSGTSPKLVLWSDGLYRWSPHNLVYPSETLATQWTANAGTISGTTFREDVTNANHIVRNDTAALIVGQPYTMTVDMQAAGTAQWVLFQMAVSESGAWFDIVNGVVGSTLTSSGSLVSKTITLVSPGVWRCTIVGIAGTQTTGGPRVWTANADNDTATHAGNVANGFNITRATVNKGTRATTYHVTTSAAWFGVPIEYDPTTAKFYALVEPAATNIALQSRAIGVAPWTSLNGPSVTANTAAGPDGTVTADTVTFPASASAEYYQAVTLATSTTYTASVFAKVASGTKAFRFNKYDGTGGASTNSSDTVATTTLQRFSWSFATNGTDTTGANVALINSSDAAAGDVIFSDYQLELGSVATSPIFTAAATVTRAADNPNALLSLMPALGSAYSMMMEMAAPDVVTATYRLSISDGSANNTGTLGTAQGTQSQAGQVVRTGSSTVVNTDGGAISASTFFKSAGRVVANDFAVSVNGAAAVTDASGALPVTPTTLYIGSNGGSLPSAVMKVRKIIVVPRAWTNAELQARTT